MWIAAGMAWAAAAGPLGAAEELDRIERAAFTYFVEQRDPASGLVYNTTEPGAPSSPAACGVALSVIPIGIERGWLGREEGYRLAREMLRALATADHERGFFYHFLDPRRGTRTWESEVSTIDSSILFAGLMVVGQYFSGTAVERLANDLLQRAEWPWLLNGEDALRWAWRPETGFDRASMQFSEAILAYLLAMGSPSHPIPATSWDALRRPISRLPASRPMVYTHDGSLFAYLLPLAWFDLRDRHDAYLDYWTNARAAIIANLRFCLTHRERFRTYREGLWGLSAALGPDGYRAYGAQPALTPLHDGTVAPYVVAASMPWIPDVALATYRRMEALSPPLWTRYGLGSALNLDRGFACPHTIALDQGLVVLMIENLRTGLPWRLFMRHPIAARAMAAARFEPGALEEPRVSAIRPGNPGASMSVPVMDHAVTLDGDLAEWIRREATSLTPVQRRHLEAGTIRDARDASVLAYLGWTHDTFYVAALVMDDEIVTRRSQSELHRDDCVELFWDLDGDGFRFDGNPRDVQVGIAPDGPAGAWQVWAWGSLNRVPPGVRAAVVRAPGRFVVEVGIPMALLDGLQEGSAVRFSLAYHDRDTDDKTGKLHWSIDTDSIPGTMLLGEMTLASGESGR